MFKKTKQTKTNEYTIFLLDWLLWRPGEQADRSDNNKIFFFFFGRDGRTQSKKKGKGFFVVLLLLLLKEVIEKRLFMDDGQRSSRHRFEGRIIVVVEIDVVDNHLIVASSRIERRNGKGRSVARTDAVVIQMTQQRVRG